MAAPMSNVCRKLARITLRKTSLLSLEKCLITVNCGRLCTASTHSYKGASAGIDIGLPVGSMFSKPDLRGRLAHCRKNKGNVELERAARNRTLQVPLDEVEKEWERTGALYHLRRIAHHYGIFQDLFDCADFLPHVTLGINYSLNKDEMTPVYSGNFVTPTEAAQAPAIVYDSPKDTLWTLMLTNPDGHLLDNNKEYIHWMIGNIPGNQLSQGDVTFDYIQPFPARGTGYHRFVFVLFKQDDRVDYSTEIVNLPCHSLKERTFETLEFYRRYQDVITPAGLAFFQSRWDHSVQEVFRTTLEMREPVFKYDHPKLHIAEQKKWPHKKPLQYLIKYMPKDKRDKITEFWPSFPDRKKKENWRKTDRVFY